MTIFKKTVIGKREYRLQSFANSRYAIVSQPINGKTGATWQATKYHDYPETNGYADYATAEARWMEIVGAAGGQLDGHA